MSASAPGSEIERRKAATRPSSPRSSRISSTTARYSRSSSRIRSPPVTPSSSGSTSIASSPSGPARRCPARPRCRPGQGDGGDAAGQAAGVDHLGDRADAAVLAVGAREQEDPLGVADVGGDRRGHAGEEDAVVERYEQELHAMNPLLLGAPCDEPLYFLK